MHSPAEETQPALASEAELFARFAAAGTFLRGHFVDADGLHAALYIDRSAIAQDETLRQLAVWQLALKIEVRDDVTAVASIPQRPETLATAVAARLASLTGEGVRAVVFAGSRRHYALPEPLQKLVGGQFVYLVHDVVQTGEVLHRLREGIQDAGGTVIAVGTFVDRQHCFADPVWSHVHRVALVTLDEPTAPFPCPQCIAQQPITLHPGQGRRFLQKLHQTDPALAKILGYGNPRAATPPRPWPLPHE